MAGVQKIAFGAGFLILCVVLLFPPYRLHFVRPSDCAERDTILERHRLTWIPIWEPNVQPFKTPSPSLSAVASLCEDEPQCLGTLFKAFVRPVEDDQGVPDAGSTIRSLKWIFEAPPTPRDKFLGTPAEARQALEKAFPKVAVALGEYEEYEARRRPVCEELHYTLDFPRLLLTVAACLAGTIGLFLVLRPRHLRA